MTRDERRYLEEEVKRFLIEREGYCEECASFVLRYYADRAYTGATSWLITHPG